jgi:hypothetical protein
MARGNPFTSSSSRYTVGSNAITSQKQGGGSKKAGFPYIIGRDHWASRFIRGCEPIRGNCCNLASLQKTLVYTKNYVRPIGGDPRISGR